MRERANHRGCNLRIKRVRTEKESEMMDQQGRMRSKIRLNDIRDVGDELQGMLAGWDTKNEENEEDNYANIEVGLMLKDSNKDEPKILEKTLFKHHVSVLLKKRYITERPPDNIAQILRQEVVKKEPPAIKEVKEGPTPSKKSTVKSLYIKKVNLVVKVKEQKDRSTLTRQSTKAKSLFFSSQQNTKRQYKLPKLQRVSLDRQSLVARSKKISFPNQSLLRYELSQLNKLLSTECVSIRQKAIS